MNAREAVKFLDRVTSGKDGLPMESITIQGPDDQYSTWSQVEEYLARNGPEAAGAEEERMTGAAQKFDVMADPVVTPTTQTVFESAGGALSQLLLDKLNFVKTVAAVTDTSTPSASPSSSSPQSSKTSPEVPSVKLAEHDTGVVPPSLKPLINAISWYIFEKSVLSTASETLFLTNSVDISDLVRRFGIMPKTIHQLRSIISLEEQEIKNQCKYHKKHPTPPSTAVAEHEPRPLFKYDEDSDEDEVVVFKPRGHGNKVHTPTWESASAPSRVRNGTSRSPIPVSSTPIRHFPQKLEIPQEEIDPDSFDRGSFSRGNTPLTNTGPHVNSHNLSFPRGSPTRGGISAGFPRGRFHRGATRGSSRGRGFGTLFQP